MELRGKAVLVTGAGSRVGTAIALELAHAGANVAVHSTGAPAQVEAACAAVRRLGVSAAVVTGDLGNPVDVERIAAESRARLGILDVLVNNAAVCRRTPIESLAEAEWDRTLAMNLQGPFLLAVQLGRWMAAAAGGVIVNIGDRLGWQPWAEHVAYCVSKAGIVALTQGLARALAPKVRVHCVVPEAALHDAPETAPLAASDLVPLQRSAEAVARMVRLVIVQEELSSGGIYFVDGTRADGALSAGLDRVAS